MTFVLLLIFIYIYDNKAGNYRSLFHAFLSVLLNLYIILTWDEMYIDISMYISFSYMLFDIIFMIIDNDENKYLYIPHHIGVLLSIIIMKYSYDGYLYTTYPKYAFLAEISNIWQQSWYITNNKYIFKIFIFFYILVRLIIIPLQLFFMNRDNIYQFIICLIGFLFVLISYLWFYNLIKK